MGMEEPEIGKRYQMSSGESSPLFWLYTGCQGIDGEKYHEFICTPLYIEVPSKKPIEIRRIKEGELEMLSGEVCLKKSQFKTLSINPDDQEFERLNTELVNFYF